MLDDIHRDDFADVLRHERLGEMPRKEAVPLLAQKRTVLRSAG